MPTSACGWNLPTNQRANHRRRCRRRRFLSEPDAARPRRQNEPDLAAGLEGAYLYEVITGTPAALAGLEAGDSIVELDGQPIRSFHDLTQQLDRILAGAEVRLNVLRSRGPKRQRMTFDVRTGSRADAAQHAQRFTCRARRLDESTAHG